MRFTDQVSDRTLVKLMTDGILLAEIQRDPRLLRYDTLILDEAHERSLNIDFLMGYLHQLLPRRPDLKVVVTSATIDPGRFAANFGGAPVVEVSGRTYPVEIRYRPLELPAPTMTATTRRPRPRSGPGRALRPDRGDRRRPRGALHRTARRRAGVPVRGTEIRDTAEAVRGRAAAGGPASRCCPCMPGSPTAEQQRFSGPTPVGCRDESCWPPTSPRPR